VQEERGLKHSDRISVIFLDLSVYSKRTQNDLLPQSNSIWHAYKKNEVNKIKLAWVSSHPLRAISPSMLGRAQQIDNRNVRFAMCEVFMLAGLLVDFKDLIFSQRSKHSMHAII